MKCSKLLLSFVSENAGIGILILDSKLNIIMINEFIQNNFNLAGKKDISLCELFYNTKTFTDYGGNSDIVYHISQAIKGNSGFNNIIFLKGKGRDDKYFSVNAIIKIVKRKKFALLSFTDISQYINLNPIFNENDYRALFENMTQCFALHEIILDKKGLPCDYRFLKINPAYEKTLGYKAENIIGKTVREILPETESYWIEKYGEVALTGKPANFEKYSAAFDKYFKVSAFSPQKGQFAAVFYDITDRKKIEEELSSSETRLKRYIDNAPDGIFIADLNPEIIRANNSLCKITGYTEEEILHKNIFTFVPAYHGEEAEKALQSLQKDGALSVEIPIERKDGGIRICSIDIIKLSLNEYTGFLKDITDKNLMQEKLQYYYYHDSLTGLYNRRYINHNTAKFNDKSMLPLSVLIGDINGLKVVNDAFGHSTGDKLIKNMAQIVKSCCGESDILAKWGGDEFILILPKSGLTRAEEIIKKIKTECESRKTEEINMSISFGWASRVNEEDNFENVLKICEDMMLKNKICESASFRSQTIKMILKTLHEKNKREEQHSIRVSKICMAIGRAMNFSDSEVNKLRVIGLVHDIGKIGIDENILNKEGKLTNYEYNEIKKHSEIGYRILSSNYETSDLAMHILSHHERYDGKGYPNGVSGDNLSVLTKILTVADSYDAMTSERPYKDALSKSEAIEELKRNSATQFAPDIVDIFINNILNTGINFEQFDVNML